MTAARREGKKYTPFVFRFRFFVRFKEDDESQTNNMKAVFSAFATSQICSTISNVSAKCSMTTVVVASLHFIINSSILYFFFCFCGILFSRSAPDAAVEPKTRRVPFVDHSRCASLVPGTEIFWLLFLLQLVVINTYLKTIVISSLNKK